MAGKPNGVIWPGANEFHVGSGLSKGWAISSDRVSRESPEERGSSGFLPPSICSKHTGSSYQRTLGLSCLLGAAAKFQALRKPDIPLQRDAFRHRAFSLRCYTNPRKHLTKDDVFLFGGRTKLLILLFYICLLKVSAT